MADLDIGATGKGSDAANAQLLSIDIASHRQILDDSPVAKEAEGCRIVFTRTVVDGQRMTLTIEGAGEWNRLVAHHLLAVLQVNI